MTISTDERESIIDDARPESVSQSDIDKISMGIYSDDPLRKKALETMVEISRDEPTKLTDTASKSLIDGLTHEETVSRLQAARAIRNFCREMPEAFEGDIRSIVDILADDEQRDIQRKAAEIIEAIGEANPDLLVDDVSELSKHVCGESLHDDEIAKRESIVIALGYVGSSLEGVAQTTVDACIDALDDPWKEVREAALQSLGRIGTENPDLIADVFGDIVSVITDDEEAPDVRVAAVDAVEQIGEQKPVLVKNSRATISTALPDAESDELDPWDQFTAPVVGDGVTRVRARVMDLFENERF
jgi:HEAT repeat protein